MSQLEFCRFIQCIIRTAYDLQLMRYCQSISTKELLLFPSPIVIDVNNNAEYIGDLQQKAFTRDKAKLICEAKYKQKPMFPHMKWLQQCSILLLGRTKNLLNTSLISHGLRNIKEGTYVCTMHQRPGERERERSASG